MGSRDVIWFSDNVTEEDECPLCGVGPADHSDLTCAGGCCFCDSDAHIGLVCHVAGPCEKRVRDGIHSPSCLGTHPTGRQQPRPVGSPQLVTRQISVPRSLRGRLVGPFAQKLDTDFSVSVLFPEPASESDCILLRGHEPNIRAAEAELRRRIGETPSTRALPPLGSWRSGPVKTHYVNRSLEIPFRQHVALRSADLSSHLAASVKIHFPSAACDFIQLKGPCSAVDAAEKELRMLALSADAAGPSVAQAKPKTPTMSSGMIEVDISANSKLFPWLIGKAGTAIHDFERLHPGILVNFVHLSNCIQIAGPARVVRAAELDMRKRLSVLKARFGIEEEEEPLLSDNAKAEPLPSIKAMAESLRSGKANAEPFPSGKAKAESLPFAKTKAETLPSGKAANVPPSSEPRVIVDAEFPQSLHAWLKGAPRDAVGAKVGALSIRFSPGLFASNVVRFAGPADRVEAAIAELRRIAATRDVVELWVPAPAEMVSFLIGGHGAAVRGLEAAFPGLRVQFQDRATSGARLSGASAVVEAGAKELRRRIAALRD